MTAASTPKKLKQQDAASLFRVLGNTTRLRIIFDLATGEKCVCNIFKRLKLPQNLVSHHLGILRKQGIIGARREGKWVYYALNDEYLASVANIFRDILKAPKGQDGC